MTGKQIRVVQWATGNVGRRALREVIRDPRLELAGVLVYDPAKDGLDAGDLCGEPSAGVRATTDKEAVIGLAADCVLYMPHTFDLDDVLAILEAGSNVVTTRGELSARGALLPEGDRARLEEACARTGTSVYHTGSSPGFITDALPMALLSLQRSVELIQIEEFADMSRRDSPLMIFEHLGYGKPLESFDPGRAAHFLREFGPALGLLADAAGLTIDEWTATGEAAVARAETVVAAGVVPAGTIGGQRSVIVGWSGGREVLRFIPCWYLTPDLDCDWDVGATGWRVKVRGEAPFDADLAFPIVLEDLNDWTPAYTANRPVNAIPYVCAAPPGLLVTLDLPIITPAGPRP